MLAATCVVDLAFVANVLMLFPDSLGSMEIGSNASMFEVFLYNIESYTKFVFFFLT